MNFKIADSKFKELLLPTLLIVMALNISSVVDSFFVGTFIGKHAVAAIDLLEPMILLATVLEWLFGLGGQIIALNKMDVTPDEKEALVKRVKEAFPEENYPVYAISAVTGEGLKELLFAINETLEKFPRETKIYESEVDPDHADLSEGTLAVYRKPDGTFIVEGTKIDKMLGYTNLDSEKGFVFFQKFLRDQGINKMLKDQGIEEGDTVWVGDLAFEYYDS